MSRIELPLQISQPAPRLTWRLLLTYWALGAIGILIGMSQDPPANRDVLPLAILFVFVSSFLPIPLMRIFSRRHVFVENSQLVIVTGVGTKRIPLAHLRARGIDVVDLGQHRELVPRMRVMAASMPGLSAGWFTLRNGEKAFCLITGQNRVSYLRSATDNVSLLLSLENPDQLKALLAH
jgi:hypothetical protein